MEIEAPLLFTNFSIPINEKMSNIFQKLFFIDEIKDL